MTDKQNRRNRRFGKHVEYQVAKVTGGSRVPGSGAYKKAQLTGDVQVNDILGHSMMKIECKGVSTISSKGVPIFTLKKKVLVQAYREAIEHKNIPLVWVHWLNGNYINDDYVIFPSDEESHAIIRSDQFLEWLDYVKIGHARLSDVEFRGDEHLEVRPAPEQHHVAVLQPRGDKTFSLRKDQLDNYLSYYKNKEEIGIVWLHWDNPKKISSSLEEFNLCYNAGIISWKGE